LQAGYSSIFARRTYSNPNSTVPFSGTAGPIVTFPLFIVEKNSHIYSVSYSTGGFEPTNIPGGTVELDIGYTSEGNEFYDSIDVSIGTTTPYSKLSSPYTSTVDISVGLELTISGTSVYNGNSGYIDTTVEYNGEPQYKLEGQSNPTIISISNPGTPEIISFNVINGTELSLYDQSWIGTGDGDLLYSVIIKESESFYYSPGPPTLWGR
jgi:hypothetical protein